MSPLPSSLSFSLSLKRGERERRGGGGPDLILDPAFFSFFSLSKREEKKGKNAGGHMKYPIFHMQKI